MTDKTLLDLYPSDLIPEHLRVAEGFLIHFPQQQQQFAELYSELPLKKNLLLTLTRLVDLFTRNSDHKMVDYCSATELESFLKEQKVPSSKSTLYNMTKHLVSAGIFIERFFKPHENYRKVKIFIINNPVLSPECPQELLNSSQSASNGSGVNQIAEAQRKEKHLHQRFEEQMLGEVQHRSHRDSMMVGVLSKSLRLDQHDTRKKLQTQFYYKKDIVNITTTTQTDSEIAVTADIRYVMAYTTYCLQIMSESLTKSCDPLEKPKNEFIIDLNKYVEMIGNRATTGNRHTALKASRRLYHTNFEIRTDAENEFANKFLDGYNEANYRFLSNLSAVVFDDVDTKDLFVEDDGSDTSDVIENPRWIRISLWPTTFDRMWDHVVMVHSQSEPGMIHFFNQDPKILNERSGIALMLFTHLSNWIGVRGNVKKTCLSTDLHLYMLPSSRYRNFFRDLEKLFNRLNDNTPIKISQKFNVNLYGYFIEGRYLAEHELRDKRQTVLELTFYRDKRDKYIGNNSFHNLLLKQAEEENNKAEPKGDQDQVRQLLNELGKNPDDIDIPKGQYFVSDDGDASLLEDYDLFQQKSSS